MRSATFIGFGAIALWGLLALLTAMTGGVPPLQLSVFTFGVGALFLSAIAVARGRVAALRPTPASLALGLYGVFGDTLLYFFALKFAPPAEANLIHYLWPLLIVLLAALLPGGKLRLAHVIGALLGLAALLLLIGGRLSAGVSREAAIGYLCAALGALVWSSYSVLSRRVAAVASESVAITCAVAALLALALHLAFESWVWPKGAEWIGVIGLGLGPMGAAFLLWDIGMKRGDVPLLGVLSYSAPVISTITLVLAGYATAGWSLAGAVLLIVVGAAIASRPQPR
ncbi:MAG: hypothetical protein BGP06_11050 [Rhizobiales bacterium 65-9]|nr:DMT family transporter [Hyphomicrobiales bacterium]OJY32866.1 MAG: hypothetical protein BGP06_11050 [Rhizobiales bacterium 65-9]